jgi:AhpD family alkylhydroperoxidase
MNYAESTDKTFLSELIKNAPGPAEAWMNFDHSIGEVESAIPVKYKELIALGVALAAQCPYCLDRHTEKAKALGVTEQEVAETIMITASIKSGAALGYGLLTLKLFNQTK